MPETPLTAKQIAEEVRRVGEAQPQHRLSNTQACRYATKDGKQPVCIVGHALHNLGVSLDVLFRLDRSSSLEASTRIESEEARDMLGLPAFNVDPETDRHLEWAGEVQSEQDMNVPWGEAVERADKSRETHDARAIHAATPPSQ